MTSFTMEDLYYCYLGHVYDLQGTLDILMDQITGQYGRLNLGDSYVNFRNWNIYANTVGQNELGL